MNKRYLLIYVDDTHYIDTTMFYDLKEAQHHMREKLHSIREECGYEDGDEMEDGECGEFDAYFIDSYGHYSWKIVEV